MSSTVLGRNASIEEKMGNHSSSHRACKHKDIDSFSQSEINIINKVLRKSTLILITRNFK